MNFHELLALILLCSAGITGIVITLVSKRSLQSRVLYTVLRIFQMTAVVIAFSEPIFTCNVLSRDAHQIPVLIDVSKSMSRFNGTTPIRSLQAISGLDSNSANRKNSMLSWFLFGDSLRSWDQHVPLTFTDNISTVPSLYAHRALSSAEDIILVTDGALSLSSASKNVLENKNIWYLPLSCREKSPYLRVECPDTIQCSRKAKSVSIPLTLAGYIPEDATLHISSPLSHSDTIPLEAGTFTIDHSINAPVSTHTFSVVKIGCLIPDHPDITVYSYVLIHIVADHVTYTVTSQKPLLDIRFIKNVLTTDTRFVHTATSSDIIITDIPPDKKHSAQNTLLLPGKPDRATARFTTSSSDVFLSDIQYTSNPFRSFNALEMPPAIVFAPSSEGSIVQRYFSVVHRNDTIPLVYVTRQYNRKTLVCGVSGFWKWDFLPLAYETGETDRFRFSRRLIHSLYEMTVSASVDTFLLVPTSTPVSSYRQHLSCILPTESFGIPDTVSCSISDTNGTIFSDTTLHFSSYRSLITDIALPPLSAGMYKIHASARSTGDSFSYTFSVNQDNAEQVVHQQNEHLLDELGTRLTLKDSSNSDVLFRKYSTPFSAQRTESRHYPLRRGWVLFGLLCGLFLLEWLLRKIQDLD